jgi:acyl-CoA synthetase (AMP-forming)/AMP-acid ligase II
MLTDDEIREQLEQLKTIVADHKSPASPLATTTAIIDGQELEVFSKVSANLGGIYRLGLTFPERTFLVYQEQRFCFAQTYQLACSLGSVLLNQYHIAKGDRVALYSRNNTEWCLAYMATTLIGAVVVPMNSWWQGPELVYGLKDCGAKLLFADPERLARLVPHLGEVEVDVIAINPGTNTDYPEFFCLLEGIEPLSEAELAALAVVPEDNASIMYTSGSTGMPKGVLSTHRNIINALYTWFFIRQVTEILHPELVELDPEFEPALLANVPLFHVTGSHAQFLACFLNQRKFVMMYKWDAEKALQLIEQERISVFHGVPTMTWEIMHSPNFASTDLRSLRAVQSGGAPRPPEHLNLMEIKFPAKAIPGLGYGLTETNAIGAIISGDFYLAKSHSTGRPTPPVTAIKIIDESGNTLDNEQVGQICIKGSTVMRGYWNDPAATEEVMKDGWFHTGDIGKLDELGFLVILDRAKDIVIRGGENIGCSEVEYAITEHPAVSEVSVYGVPDDRLGEILIASVMLHADEQLDVAELQDFLAAKIARFKIPEQIYFQYEQLPRIASGKIAKKEIRQATIARLNHDIPEASH